MPITPVQYQPRPYVRGGTLGELIRLRGQREAESHLRGGDISAQLYANLGSQLSGILSGYVKERQEAPIRAQDAESRALQVQAQQQQVDERDRLTRQDAAFTALLEQQPHPDPREVMRIFGPQRGTAIAQGMAAFGELSQQKVTDARDTAGRLAIGIKALSPALQASFWPSIRRAAVQGGLGDEQSIPEQFMPEFVEAVIGWASGKGPEAPPALMQRDPTRDLVDPRTGQVVSAGTPDEERVTYGQPIAAMVNGRRVFVRPGSDNRAYTMTGQAIDTPITPIVDRQDTDPLVSVVGDDGKPVLMRRRDAVGRTPASGTQRPASGLERRALNFFNRARQADVDLETLEDDIRAMGVGGQARMALAPNVLQSELGQLYTQSQRAFTEARLRKDSGAAIPEQEFENDRRTYFVQPGDTTNVIAQKRRGRAAVLASLWFEAGQALSEFEGDPAQAERMVNEFKQRSARAADDTPNLSGLREGSEREFRSGPFAGQVWTVVNGQPRQVR
jgi:hypothetical protein